MSPAVAEGSQPNDVRDSLHASSNFCDDLYRELQESGLLHSLKPAKTVGERNHPPSILLEMLGEKARIPVPSGTSKGTIRGDNSLFVAREFRQQANFAIQHPHLSRLIATVTETVQSAFDNQSNCNADNDNENRPNFQFDYDQTSVQVAMYPGDGVSGYVRHCDRGQAFCRQEDSKAATSTTSSNPPPSSTTTPQRLLTCVYYLTPHDWNQEQDGGALRVFHEHQGKTTDICPNRDRMVVFRADKIEHQVLPSLRRPRTAITLWFYGTIRQPSLNMTSSAPRLLLPPLTIQDSSSTSISTTATIFVSIASYRDSELRPTLDALFGAANNSQRISVGVVLQLDSKHSYDQKIEASLEDMQYASQLRILRLDARDAMGPCYARGLCQTLWRDEDYVLQIDSHMRFRQSWDFYLVETHSKIESTQQSRGVILTTYPSGYTLPHNITHMETSGTYLVPWKFDDHGMLRQRGRLLKEKTASDNTQVLRPRAHLHYLYAGGFNFGTARACIHDVPYDTMGLSNIFFGEELSMSIRFYTHGYDMYAPTESVVYHLWSRAHRPPPTALKLSKEEEAKRDQQKAASRDKVNRQLLGDKTEIGIPCGLGTVRRVADYGAALGIDFCQHKFLRDNVACGILEESDFADVMIGDENDVGTSPEKDPKLKSKVAALDPKARALIGFFLTGVHGAP